jgi:hypothetical protein
MVYPLRAKPEHGVVLFTEWDTANLEMVHFASGGSMQA